MQRLHQAQKDKLELEIQRLQDRVSQRLPIDERKREFKWAILNI